MPKLVEIRTYQLKPGTGGKFHQCVLEQSVPLHAQWGIDVVTFGQSLGDPDTYVLIRAYEGLAHLESSQSAFYASSAWREGPREAIVSMVQSDSNAVLWLDHASIDQLRRACGMRPRMETYEMPHATISTWALAHSQDEIKSPASNVR